MSIINAQYYVILISKLLKITVGFLIGKLVPSNVHIHLLAKSSIKHNWNPILLLAIFYIIYSNTHRISYWQLIPERNLSSQKLSINVKFKLFKFLRGHKCIGCNIGIFSLEIKSLLWRICLFVSYETTNTCPLFPSKCVLWLIL